MCQWFQPVHGLDYQDPHFYLNIQVEWEIAHHKHEDQKGGEAIKGEYWMRGIHVHNVVQQAHLQGCASPMS
jgi:hypothetical protein